MFRFLLYEFIQMRHTAELGLLKHLKLKYTSQNLHVATNALISRGLLLLLKKNANTSRSSVYRLFSSALLLVLLLFMYI